MKLIQICAAFFVFFLFSCADDSESDSYESLEEALEEVVQEMDVEEAVEPNSVKSKLLGLWEAKNDPTLRIEISSSKYRTYDQDTKVWDQEWDLTDGESVETAFKDDNGDHIWVFDQEGNAFFIAKIVSLTDSELVTLNIKGGGTISERRYMKIK